MNRSFGFTLKQNSLVKPVSAVVNEENDGEMLRNFYENQKDTFDKIHSSPSNMPALIF